MALPEEDETHIDFEANVSGKPIRFRLVAYPNKKYGPNGVDIALRHDREQMLEAHGREMNENERQFAILSTLYLALRSLAQEKEKKEYKDQILNRDKGRFDLDE